MTIVLMGIQAKEIPLKPRSIQPDKDGKDTIYCDSSGRKVISKAKIVGSTKREYVYADDSSVFEGKPLRMVKGKPTDGFERTTVIESYETIEIADMAHFVSNEYTYMLVSDKLKSQLQELGTKAVSFKFVNRKGLKVYRAVAYYDKELNRALMRLYRGNLKQMELPEDTDVKEIESDVETLNLDDFEI